MFPKKGLIKYLKDSPTVEDQVVNSDYPKRARHNIYFFIKYCEIAKHWLELEFQGDTHPIF